MKKGWATRGVKTVGFMVTLTLVSILSVSGLHVLTASRVSRNAGLFLQRAVLDAAGRTVPSTPAEIASLFADQVDVQSRDGHWPEFLEGRYRVRADDAGTIEVWHVRASGLWGAVHAMVGVDSSAAAVTGLAFIEHNETPGLGARIEEPWFRRQFRGKRAPSDGERLRWVEEDTPDPGPDEFNGITGATTSTRAVAEIVTRALAATETSRRTEGD